MKCWVFISNMSIISCCWNFWNILKNEDECFPCTMLQQWTIKFVEFKQNLVPVLTHSKCPHNSAYTHGHVENIWKLSAKTIWETIIYLVRADTKWILNYWNFYVPNVGKKWELTVCEVNQGLNVALMVSKDDLKNHCIFCTVSMQCKFVQYANPYD